jgi:hypothetical protein
MFKLGYSFLLILCFITSCTREKNPSPASPFAQVNIGANSAITVPALNKNSNSCKDTQKTYVKSKFGDNALDLPATVLLDLIMDNQDDFFASFPRCEGLTDFEI